MFPILKKKVFVNSRPLNQNIFRFGNMAPEIEIKVSESGTTTEIRNTDFQFRDNEYCYLFIQFFTKFFQIVLTYTNEAFENIIPDKFLKIIKSEKIDLTYSYGTVMINTKDKGYLIPLNSLNIRNEV